MYFRDLLGGEGIVETDCVMRPSPASCRRVFSLLVLLGLWATASLAAPPLAHSEASANVAKHGVLKISPPNVSFGNVQVGYSETLTETLANTGGADLTVYSATTSGTGFTTSGLNVPMVLPPGQSFTFSITFAPQSSGSTTGSVLVSSQNGHATRAIPLTGTGTAAGQLTVSPSTLAFGNVTVGTIKNLTGTLTATGTSVTVLSGTSSSSEFALSRLSYPFTIGAGQSASFTVKFTPQTSGAASGTVSFESDAVTSPTVESLTGTGTAPNQHMVGLQWDPSTSVVVGYNVYRGSTSGGPYGKINPALDPGTTYADASVKGGQTYYYVTTSVDGNGDESSYSNEVQAAIPFP